MIRCVKLAASLLLLSTPLALAHDPRTTARTFTHQLEIEGAGKLSLSFKGLHFNDATYQRMKSNDQFRERMNGGVWSDIGRLDTAFEVTVGGKALSKGSYKLGLSIGAGDAFSVVLTSEAGNAVKIPLQITAENPDHPYLTFAIYATDKTDIFVLEGRCGKFEGTAEVKVPYLVEHAHPGEKK